MAVMHKEIPKPSPAQFTEDFPSVRPDLILNRQKPPDSPEMARYVNMCHEVDEQMERAGFFKAVVINLQPFPLHVNGVLVDHMVVPGVDEDTEKSGHVYYFETKIDGRELKIPYVAYLIPHYVQDKKDLGDFNFVPYAEPPSKLAYDFEHEFVGEGKPGGVFFYLGDGIPGLSEGEVDPDKKISRAIKGEQQTTIRALFERAYKQMIRFAQAKFREADAEATKPNGNRSIINKFHRDAVKTLIRAGYMTAEKTPSWFTLTHIESTSGVRCPVCRKTNEKGAIACATCNYVYDVAAAYDHGVIGPDSTHIRRMSVKDMRERGIDPAQHKPNYKAGDGEDEGEEGASAPAGDDTAATTTTATKPAGGRKGAAAKAAPKA
jgi:hypothetical protein